MAGLERIGVALSQVIVIADRFDSLGARLSAIVAGRAVADALGCDYGFVWEVRPENIDYAAGEFFDAAFCARYLRSPDEFVDWDRIRWHEMRALTLQDARGRVDAVDRPTVLRYEDAFSMGSFAGEEPEVPARRFQGAFDGVSLAAEPGRLRALVDDAMTDVTLAVHARLGDLVTGPWSQFPQRGKFRPAAFIDEAIERLHPEPLVVISDTVEFVSSRARRYEHVQGLDEVIPGYEGLSEQTRSWVDLFALMAVDRIIAPASSAFSRFAAAVSGGEIVDALSDVPEQERVALLRRHVGASPEEPTAFFEQLRAREICYLLDSANSELSVTERDSLAQAATRMDPQYVGGHARRAVTAAARGRWQRAQQASDRAIALSELNTVHDDPRVEAYVGALVQAAARAAVSGHDATARLDDLCSRLHEQRPYQQPAADIRRAADHVRLTSRLLAGNRRARLVGSARRRLRRLTPSAAPPGGEPMIWDDDGNSPALASLEMISWWMGDWMSGSGSGSGFHAPQARFRSLRSSANGIAWFECEVEGADRVPGLVVEGAGLTVCAPRAWATSAVDRNLFWMPAPAPLADILASPEASSQIRTTLLQPGSSGRGSGATN